MVPGSPLRYGRDDKPSVEPRCSKIQPPSKPFPRLRGKWIGAKRRDDGGESQGDSSLIAPLTPAKAGTQSKARRPRNSPPSPLRGTSPASGGRVQSPPPRPTHNLSSRKRAALSGTHCECTTASQWFPALRFATAGMTSAMCAQVGDNAGPKLQHNFPAPRTIPTR
jgi:hypothetical protein